MVNFDGAAEAEVDEKTQARDRTPPRHPPPPTPPEETLQQDLRQSIATALASDKELSLAASLSSSFGSGTSTPARPNPHGIDPAKHVPSRWRFRPGGANAKKLGYDPVNDNDHDDDTASDTLYVDEEAIASIAPRTRRRRRWLICAMVCGFTLLVVILVLNVFLFVASRAWDESGDDPDAIFANWGRPGTGTEGLAWYPTDFLRDVQPIPCHSHNDYWRKVPVFSALHAGCTGIESDVWLFPDRGDDLFVGHDTAALQPNRTFRSLYVDPLVDILRHQNPSHEFYNETRRGVFDVNPDQTLVLLVDVKTDGASTWRKVVEQLEPLRSRGYLSRFDNGKVIYGPITVVGTGDTPFDVLMENSTYRDYFFDAPLRELEGSKYDSTNSYYSSTSFGSALGSVWLGGLKPGQLDTLRKQVKEAHSRGLKARYWDLPAWPIHVRNNIWQALVREGVDMLNVDDLKSAAGKDWTKSWPF